jgi:transporter family-2 protein
MLLVLLLSAVLVGTLMPLQAVINAQLGRELASPIASAFISFLGGTVILGLITLFFPTKWERLTSLPLWMFVGGLLGAVFVAAALILVPRIGATALMATFMAGQLIMSLAMDHYGWFGLATRPLDLLRLCGVLCVVAGIVLMTRTPHAP